MARKPSPHRRRFLKQSAVVTAATALTSPVIVSTNETNSHLQTRSHADDAPTISVFTKPFNSLSFEDLAKSIADAGFDGIEAPIRRGGHIDLAKVEEELPQLVDALKQQQLQISIMASDINRVDERSGRILKVAAELGIKRYRLAYFKYDLSKNIKAQLKNWTKTLSDLAAMNRELGIVGLYQNHVGTNTFGAALWDLAEVVEAVDSEFLGITYDIRHATAEGGTSWKTTMRRVMPLVQMMYAKDFRWTEKGKIKNVPLGDGLISNKFYQLATEFGFSGPISLHEEYLSHKDPSLVPQHLEAMKKDLQVLKKWISASKK
ncbi:MAG: TIM barrel protein [Planctomycetota bacterium]